MKLDAKTLLGTLLLILVPVMLLGLGYWAGRYTVSIPFRQQLDGRSRADTLGSLLGADKQKQIASTYFEPDVALADMDNISWAVPNIPAPFVGHLPTPGQHGNAIINSLQLRYENEIQVPKPTNVYRIFITGGSTAYGSGAPSQDSTIAGFLQRLLLQNLTPSTGLQYEVITAANPAWSSTHERIFIENRLSELEPDMVISFSGNNDVHWGQLGRNVLWFRSYDDDIYLALLKNAYAVSGYADIPENTEIEAQEVSASLVAERLIKNVRLSSYVLESVAADYVFILQPTLAVTDKSLTTRETGVLNEAARRFTMHRAYFQDSYMQMDRELSEFTAVNFTYINLAAIFDKLPEDEEIFLDSYHFGDKGYAQIAEAIYVQLEELLAP